MFPRIHVLGHAGLVARREDYPTVGSCRKSAPPHISNVRRWRAGLMAIFFIGWTASGWAANFTSNEDRSRFQEQSYKQAEPGMLSPAEYIALAEKAVHKRYPKVTLSKSYQDGVVTHRFYHNAPKEDQDVICVSFVYRTPLGGGFVRSQYGVVTKPKQDIPVLQALIRKDRSKIYVNWVKYRRE